ncbi:protein daughter of sevenless [Culicoides brevitarsis]|uniref:protein daughter of sevenless n=1 Tax=Culicoides brevitarsis TaxID=469753 RepID=UPI00307BB595
MSLGNKMKSKSETIFSGWLVKSPPRKKFEKIWKLKWRRRWFTLKQGELPGQFFLEYYTDSDCNKLKGQIDLDQCEQVDAGLRMLDKFQHMFDIKTPHRIYYLAAESEEDMRGWVKWICQVCCLHETRGVESNVAETIQEVPNTSLTSTTSSEATTRTDVTDRMLLNNNVPASPGISLYSNMYQNTFSDMSFRGSVAEYCNRQTILISEAHKMNTLNNNNNNSITQFDRSIAEAYTNFSTIKASIERSHSLKGKPLNSTGASHSRTQSLDEHGAMLKQQSRKFPEALKPTNTSGDKKPSPSLSSSSGPYIPISECFSGGAYRITGEHKNSFSQYSPKSLGGGQNVSDSESVFTDDEWTHPVMPHHTLTRNKLQSETSLDKDQLTWAYVQRFSKVPAGKNPPPRPPKRTSGIFSANSNESGINNKESPLPSPSAFTAPKDRTVESYERSQNMQKNIFDNGLPTPGFSPLDAMNVIASSTPNLIVDTQQGVDGSRTLPHSRQNFYTNATPGKGVDGYIFRYDFSDQTTPAPVVNRKLKPGTKPKTISESNVWAKITNIKQGQEFYTLDTPPKKNGPQVDRKLKPTSSSKAMNITLPDEHTLNNMLDDKYPGDRLQYLDLDHSNTPVTPKKVTPKKQNFSSGGPQGATSTGNLLREKELLSSVAYTTVDFVKTDAFNRIREEARETRMKK